MNTIRSARRQRPIDPARPTRLRRAFADTESKRSFQGVGSGQFEQALERLQHAEQVSGNCMSLKVLIHLFLAMTHHRRNQTDEARQSLHNAVWIIDQQFPKPGN